MSANQAPGPRTFRPRVRATEASPADATGGRSVRGPGGLIQNAAVRWVFAGWLVLVHVLFFRQFDQYWDRLLLLVRGVLRGVA